MSDDIERREKERQAEAKRRLSARKMREKWAREGYDPGRHLALTCGEGDWICLLDMHSQEVGVGGRHQIGAMLAALDIRDTVNAVRHNRRLTTAG
jgi:hypothetical protein